jgi:tRNA1Val (adenine37-N6)-methyltransferase
MDITLDSIRDIRLYQSRTGYRFSVDSLLLYDFVNLRKVSCVADLGAGSGIVGILLAKKYPDANITLFELQESLVRHAERNLLLNKLEDRIRVVKADITKLTIANSSLQTPNFYDLAVSNPPFRRLKSGLMNIEEEKAIARHEIKLRLHELINAASYLLKARGRFCMIYHPCRLSYLVDTLKKRGLEPKRLRFVHSTISSEAKMILMEAVKGGKEGLKVDKPLYIYKENGRYTDELEEIYNPSLDLS